MHCSLSMLTPESDMTRKESLEVLYRFMVDRCQSLEANQARLTEQLCELAQHKQREEDDVVTSDSDETQLENFHQGFIPGYFSSGNPYRSVLDSMGLAVHVRRASSGEIIYWNRPAENLYGWKDYEVVGQSVAVILVNEEYCLRLQKITEKLYFGQSWSGQFPFKKRSGEIFMAMMTKSLLYENDEIVGVITVASDATFFNSTEVQSLKTYNNAVSGRNRTWRMNLKKIQWHPQTPIVPVPEIASSLSHLASKFCLRRQGDNTVSTSEDRGDCVTDTKHSIERPVRLAAKFLAKLHIKRTGNVGSGDDGGSRQYGADDNSQLSHEVTNEATYPRDSKASTSYQCFVDTESKGQRLHGRKYSFATKGVRSYVRLCEVPNTSEGTLLAPSSECMECCGSSSCAIPLSRLSCHVNVKKVEQEVSNLDAMKVEMQGQPDGKQVQSSGETFGSHGSSPGKKDTETNLRVECEIKWEDLHLGEEIGQGSYATVYHGIWNGSDVAIKVYTGNEYTEETFLDHKKEIDIMKRLRHPNVLLYMGCIYSQARLAVVTEFLPRGSLFKALHRNSQSLDNRRCLRMAIDVAKGMNYLHRRNPPIVHGDLKSSNLLVDKNWTVKVGDFGLSRLKHATLLSAKSGRGTPQWMAPEVLRSEPSNEKSDVFSYGVILWELMTRSIPWSNLNSLQVVGVVGFMDRRLELPDGLDPQVATIIDDCWRSDPQQRPSFEEIIQKMITVVQKIVPVATQRS